MCLCSQHSFHWVCFTMMGQQRKQSLLAGSLHSGVEIWIHLSRWMHSIQVINAVCGGNEVGWKVSRSGKNAMGMWDCLLREIRECWFCPPSSTVWLWDRQASCLVSAGGLWFCGLSFIFRNKSWLLQASRCSELCQERTSSSSCVECYSLMSVILGVLPHELSEGCGHSWS